MSFQRDSFWGFNVTANKAINITSVYHTVNVERWAAPYKSWHGVSCLRPRSGATGSRGSHTMVVVLDPGGMTAVTAPTVVQECRNHGGKLFKVSYAYGRAILAYSGRVMLREMGIVLRNGFFFGCGSLLPRSECVVRLHVRIPLRCSCGGVFLVDAGLTVSDAGALLNIAYLQLLILIVLFYCCFIASRTVTIASTQGVTAGIIRKPDSVHLLCSPCVAKGYDHSSSVPRHRTRWRVSARAGCLPAPTTAPPWRSALRLQ